MDKIMTLSALLPVAVLLFYIYRTDPYKEPFKQLRKAFFYGVLIVLPVSIVEAPLALLIENSPFNHTVLGSTMKAFFVAAIPEEGFKLLALWLVVRKNPYFDEHFDGIVYAVFVSLGFAALENIGYVFQSGEDWMTVSIARALLAVPGHYAFGVLMGYFFSIYYFINRSRKYKYLVLVAPVLAHGIYDTLAFYSEISETMGLIGFVLLIVFCVRLHRLCFKKLQAHLANDQRTFSRTSRPQ